MKKFSVDILLKAINQTSGATNAAIANLDKIQSKMDDLNERAEKFNKIGGSLQGIGLKVGAAGLAMGAGLGYAAKKYGDFEENITKSSILLGDSTAKGMETYGQEIQNIAMRTGKSQNDLANAMRLGASANLTASESLTMLGSASNVAVAGFAETSDAMKTLLQMYTAYGNQLDKTKDFAYQLVLVDKYAANSDMSTLAPAISQIAAAFGMAGIKSHEMLAALAAITQHSDSAAIAATNAYAAIKAITDPELQPLQTKALEELNKGLSKEQQLKFGPSVLMGENGLESWLGKLNDMSGGGNAEIIARLFPGRKEATTGVINLLKQYKLFQQASKDLSNTQKGELYIQDKMKIALDITNGKWNRLKATFEVVTSKIGKAIGPVFDRIILILLTAGEKVASFIDNNQGLVKVLGYVALGLAAVLAVAGGIIVILGTILTYIGGFIAAKIAFMGAMAALAPFIAILQAAGAAIVAFFGGVSAPLIGIALAIAAALGVIGTFLYGFFSGLMTGLSPIFDWIGEKVDWIGEKISGIVDSIKGFFIRIINWIQTALSGLVTIGKGLGLKIGEGISGLFFDPDTNKKIVDEMGEKEKKMNSEVTDDKKSKAQRLAELLKRLMADNFGDNKKTNATEIIDIFGGVAGRFLTSQYVSSGENENGYAADGITAAVAAGRGNASSKRSTNIQNVVLPNVTDTNSFMYEMERMSLSMGT
jgi:TP901 family phage tail tape measure protein